MIKVEPPLHYAVEYCFDDCVKLLLEYGADPNARDNRGKTPADIAKQRGFGEIAALLKKASKQRIA